MRSAPFHLDRYNASLIDTCFDSDPVVHDACDQRASIDRPPDPTFLNAPRHLQLIEHCVDYSHTEIKKKSCRVYNTQRHKRFEYLSGLRRAEYYIIYIYYINI